jgi:hypothetical protein
VKLSPARPASLPRGLILEFARLAGMNIPHDGGKVLVRCPFHDDARPSAFLSADRNLFYCSVCTPGGGISCKSFAQALGLPWGRRSESWRRVSNRGDRPRVPTRGGGGAQSRDNLSAHELAGRSAADRPRIEEGFPAATARRVWGLARDRVANDTEYCQPSPDADVYEYLEERGLKGAWGDRAYGVLSASMALPPEISWWPAAGYRLVVPLHDSRGRITNLQTRCVRRGGDSKKVLVPKGSRLTGTMFANTPGRQLLAGTPSGQSECSTVVLGEGLTDHLALTTVRDVVVLSVPGTGVALAGIGDWAAGCVVRLALDCDDAGNRAIKPVSKACYAHGAREVRRITWPRGCKDACDCLRVLGDLEFAAFVRGSLTGGLS